MKLSDFFKLFRKEPASNDEAKADYLPSFWEDDYCQIEIVPSENIEHILKTIDQINDLATHSGTDSGFTETFGRGPMPVTTFSREIRTDYLQRMLTDSGFEKAKNIRYNGRKILDCETGLTKAYGSSNFTVFFDTEQECVKNIWLSTHLIISVRQKDSIESVFTDLGEQCKMVLIDWTSLELFDLRDQKQIDDYLMGYWK